MSKENGCEQWIIEEDGNGLKDGVPTAKFVSTSYMEIVTNEVQDAFSALSKHEPLRKKRH